MHTKEVKLTEVSIDLTKGDGSESPSSFIRLDAES